MMLSRAKPFLAGLSFAGMILASGAAMADPEHESTAAEKEWQTEAEKEWQTDADVAKNEQDLSGPEEDVQESAEVLKQLKADDPELAQKLSEAKGVFIIPDYATAALLVGGSGGEGVLLDRRDGQWGNPGFYDIGNIDIGAQAGGAAGAIVMLLMTDEAFENFTSETEFSLTAEAGLTLINWSAQASAEDGDVLIWSDTEGLLAEASVGVGGISWDEEENREYYGQEVTAEQVLAGDVQNPHEDVLQSEFAEFTTEQQ
jgi:lipid-binding SYLF domain-containing protein